MIQKINLRDVKPIEDPCGLLRELYNSENISVAHNTVLGEAEEHMHRRTEEIYYIVKGKGQVVIGGETIDIEEGDLIPIPKNTWHYLRKIDGKDLEVLVVTHPKYDPSDLILRTP